MSLTFFSSPRLLLLSCVIVTIFLSSVKSSINDALDVSNDLSYITVPFGGAVETVYNLPIMRELLGHSSESDLSSFNPKFGKLGIAMVAIYGVRNARMSLQHFQGSEQLLLNLLSEHNSNNNNNNNVNLPQSLQQMVRDLTRAESELFTAFYHWNERSGDASKWHKFSIAAYKAYNNRIAPYRPLFARQATLDAGGDDFASRAPLVASNSLNYGINARLFDEDVNGPVTNSYFRLKKGSSSYKNIKNDKNGLIPDIVLNNGVSVPLVGFGSWPLTGEKCYEALMLAIKNGYRLIDTSQNYNNEDVVARAIEDSIRDGTIKDRTEIIIADKLSFNQDFGNETQQTRKAFETQLQKLKTDYIDIYMIHGPIGDKERLKQAWYSMEELYFESKIRVLAVSNYNMWELRELIKYARVVPAMLQTKFDVFTQGAQAPWVNNVRPLAQKYDIYIQGYCIQNSWPGQLPAISDFHVRYLTQTKFPGRTETQVLLRWAYQYGIAMLVRSSNSDRQRQNIDIFAPDFELSDEDMLRLNGLITMYSPFRVSWMNDIYLLEKRDQ